MSVTRQGNKIFLTTGSHTYYYDETESILGEGAMGVVFRGFELGTGKAVAIKQVREEYSNNVEIRRRAHLEASLMFSHPNLVEMLGCCEIAPSRGPIFIISSYVEGENIDKFINRKIRNLPHAEHRICNMFIPVLDALSYIHQKNIIHMDIKPSNIMVENERNIRLMDLGIADVSLMKSDVSSGMMGTPKYAAPEQFSNTQAKSKLSPATDIYEAGVTLYELLTKQNPFPNKVSEARKMHESVVLEKTPAISDDVLDVIRKATEVNPSDRYQKASEMKRALQEAIRHPTPTKRIDKMLIIGCVFFLFLLAVFGLLLWANYMK
jgi:serine/threonine-protein kinase